MSRIGRMTIDIPTGIKVEFKDNIIHAKGDKGELFQSFPDFIDVKIKDNKINVFVLNPELKKQKSMWGTASKLIFNMIEGLSKGFTKQLKLVGVGYRAETRGDVLILKVGFSHLVEFPIPVGIDIKAEKDMVTVSGIDKQAVGDTAAKIRRIRKPEPYKGRGIRYKDEVVLRKAGKKATAGDIA
ncbi:50S ribosomal protein L6 [Patescibacteria group bacterium]|nr:50S ribosomal protein L6 [Patescibacteria group bacterium]